MGNTPGLVVVSFVRTTLRGVEVGFRGPGQALPAGALAAPDRLSLASALCEVTRQPAWVERNQHALQALARPALLSAGLPYDPGCSWQSFDVDGIEVSVCRHSPFFS